MASCYLLLLGILSFRLCCDYLVLKLTEPHFYTLYFYYPLFINCSAYAKSKANRRGSYDSKWYRFSRRRTIFRNDVPRLWRICYRGFGSIFDILALAKFSQSDLTAYMSSRSIRHLFLSRRS